MAYTDAMEPLIALEQELRHRIARRLALENGEPVTASPDEAQLAAAAQAIEAWREDGDATQDPRAFRPQTPLEILLADHAEICARINDLSDRRLS